MTNCRMNSVEEYDDINTRSEYALARSAGLSDAEALDACYRFSRDNSRTPMQWDDSPNAGFTTGKPWLKVNPNYVTVNVAEQEKREDSVLNYYKKLIALRKSPEYREVLTYGDFQPEFETEENILAYRRILNGKAVLVVANFGPEAKELRSDLFAGRKVLLSNAAAALEDDRLCLETSQVVVLA